jgi:hypothetical protein
MAKKRIEAVVILEDAVFVINAERSLISPRSTGCRPPDSRSFRPS